MLMRIVLAGLMLLTFVRAAAAGPQVSSGLLVHVLFAPPLAPTSAILNLSDETGTTLVRSQQVAFSTPGWFGDLAEATYVVAVSAPGVTSSGPATSGVPVRVGPGEVVIVEIAVSAAGEATLRVRGRWRGQEGARFAGAMVRDLPSAGDVWSLVETAAPFVIADRMDTGGVGTGRSAVVGSRGESWATTAIAFGEAPVRFPDATGQLPIVPPINGVESVSVSSGLAPVEVGTPGVVIRLEPRRPGSRPLFGGDLSWTTPSMVGENALVGAPSIARIDRWRQAGVFGGGPITARAGLFVAVDSRFASFSERARAALSDARSTSVFAHYVHRLSDRDELRVLGGIERARAPFAGRSQLLDSDGVTARDTFGRAQVTWHHVGPSGLTRTISVGGHRARSTPLVSSTVLGGVVDRVLDGVVPPPPSLDTRYQWNVRFDTAAAPFRSGAMVHLLRFGVTAERVRTASSVIALPVVAESVAGLPARVWMPVRPDVPSARGLTDVALYLADRLAMGRSLVVDLGIRTEAAYGSARGALQGINWRSVRPRVSFRWQTGRFGAFGGFGEYTAANALSLTAFGDPGAVAFDVHRWNDGNGDGLHQPGETGVLVARRGRNRAIASIDAGLAAPVSRELTIGGEFHATPRSTIGTAIIIRRTRQLVGSVNDGVPFASYRLFTVPDIGEDEGHPADDQQLPIYERQPATFGADQFRLTNPDRPDTTYGGIEITWNIDGERWNMLFGATAYRTRGWGGDLGFGPLENDQLVIGERFENPNAADDVAGSFIFDRSYVGKVAGSYRAKGDVRFAFAVRYQDGQPFTRYVVAPDLAGGPEVVHAYRVGRTRFTYTATVDVRLEKGLVLAGRRAAVRFDVFNLTNHANEVEEDVLSGASFRRSTATQPPRTARLGLSLDF